MIQAVGLISPGIGQRGPNEPPQILTYSADPNAPMVQLSDRDRLMLAIDNGWVVVTTHDYRGLVTESATLVPYSDAQLQAQFLFVDTVEDHGGPGLIPGENPVEWEHRQHARSVQMWCLNYRQMVFLTKVIWCYRNGTPEASQMTPENYRVAVRNRYLLCNGFYVRTTYAEGPQGQATRVLRPNENCSTCRNVDPKTDIYCEACYKILGCFI
jgi:hypothetical protein